MTADEAAYFQVRMATSRSVKARKTASKQSVPGSIEELLSPKLIAVEDILNSTEIDTCDGRRGHQLYSTGCWTRLCRTNTFSIRRSSHGKHTDPVRSSTASPEYPPTSDS